MLFSFKVLENKILSGYIMKAGRVSRTAEAAAALRANHHLNANDPVFSDPYAFEMTMHVGGFCSKMAYSVKP